MRIIVKILLTFVVIFIWGIFQEIINKTGNNHTAIIRLLPAIVLILGIYGVWKYKPQNGKSDNTDLDKTL